MTPESKRTATVPPPVMVPTSPSLRPEDFEYVRGLLHQEAAIVLDRARGSYTLARLDALATREGFASTAELVARLRLNAHDGLRPKVVGAMVQNETSFFRDPRPFQEVRQSVLPDLIARRLEARRLRIWSAACSSGQEPYSLAMILLEHVSDPADWDLSILASDLSTEMVDRARLGRYTQAEVNRGLPAPYLIKYFRRDGLEWAVNDAIRRPVEFRSINLVGPWSMAGQFDLIVLRNALIYFGIDDRKTILERIARVLAPDGYLWLGAAETTLNLVDRFERVEPECGSIYRLRPD